MTPEALAAIRERAEKATAGPWTNSFPGASYVVRKSGKGRKNAVCEMLASTSVQRDADADFIAASRTDIPDLLAYVAELEAKLNASSDYRMEAVCANCGETYRQHLGYDCAAKPGLVFKPKSP